MKKWIPFLLLLAAHAALAAGGEAHEAGPVEVPKTVIYQVINVVLLFIGLMYFLKAPIVKFYKERRAHYLFAAEKSKAARDRAEKEYLEIKHKLSLLESSENDSYNQAQLEAKNLRQQMMKDAEEMSARIKHEAEETAKIEIQKAQQHLREQLLKDAVQISKEMLASEIGTAEHQKLQGEFVNNVQAVHP